jgi:hypothetical protein
MPVDRNADGIDDRNLVVDRNRDGIDDRNQVVDRNRDGIDDRNQVVDRNRDGIDDRNEVADRRVVADPAAERREVVGRQREAFGGVKIGSAFFGWLTATGTAVILTALLAATGAALGLGVIDATDSTAAGATVPTDTIGWIGAIALLVILFVSYWCGGYVAGRMARFNGFIQGLAVWVWALVIAIVVALLSVVLGSQYDVLGNLNSFPRIPVSEGQLTLAGIITAAIVVVASLGGAILGGKAGTHYHRKVDRAGFVDAR